MSYMAPLEIRDIAIEQAIESVHAHEKRPFRLQGCLLGLEICRSLDTQLSFEKVISERQKWEGSIPPEMLADPGEFEAYWEHRCATAQVAWIFEIMKVVWGIEPLSARAVLAMAHIRSIA